MSREQEEVSQIQSRLAELTRSSQVTGYKQVRSLLGSLSPADTAHLLESSPPDMRDIMWGLLTEERQGEILQHLGEDLLNEMLASKTTTELLQLLEDLDPDDLTDILQQLPVRVTHQVLNELDAQHRRRIENLMTYTSDSAGGLMNTDIISVRPRFSLDVVLRYLRRHSHLPPATDTIFVVNQEDRFLGSLPLTALLVSDPGLTVREAMLTSEDLPEPIAATTSARDVALLFERHDLVSAPVVDEEGRLLGRITVDDVMDVVREEGDRSFMFMAGLREDDDAFAPVLRATRRRTFWLGTNLLTAFLASAVINLFEDTIAKVVALAVLMPIVASMGGVAGSQTLTLMIRSMAQGQVNRTNTTWLVRRELSVGTLNGIIWALVVACAATLVFNDIQLGIIIAAAMVINLIISALAGVSLPLLLRHLKIDPAIAGSVILTTVTDVVGFLSFLGLATLVYA